MKTKLWMTLAAGAVWSGSAQVPVITSQPRGQSNLLEGHAIFTTTASGIAPLSYRWLKNGTNLSAAMGDVLILSRRAPTDTGTYSVRASNVGGAVTSSNASLTVSAPQAGDVDFSFAFGSSINGTIYALTALPDVKVLVGGAFATVGGAVRGRVARLNADGGVDDTFMNGLAGANGSVYSMAVQDDGKVVVGGDFTVVNGITRNRIARLNADGTVDTGVQNGLTGVSNTVYGVAVEDL